MRGFTLAGATLVSFSQQSPFFFFVLISIILEEDSSQKYAVTNDEYLKGFFANKRVRNHLVTHRSWTIWRD